MRTHLYRITIAGRLGALGREVFAGLDITSDGPATVLAGVLDQAALYGVLNRIQALGLELVGVTRPASGPYTARARASPQAVRPMVASLAPEHRRAVSLG